MGRICHPVYNLNKQMVFLKLFRPVKKKHHSVIDRCPFGGIAGFYSTETDKRIPERIIWANV